MIPHLYLQSKFKLLVGKFIWCNKAKHCWVMSTNFLFSKVCWQHPAMFCLITSSKLSRPQFEFSLKVKVMGSNSSYLLKSFLLYVNCDCTYFELDLSLRIRETFSRCAELWKKIQFYAIFTPFYSVEIMTSNWCIIINQSFIYFDKSTGKYLSN